MDTKAKTNLTANNYFPIPSNLKNLNQQSNQQKSEPSQSMAQNSSLSSVENNQAFPSNSLSISPTFDSPISHSAVRSLHQTPSSSSASAGGNQPPSSSLSLASAGRPAVATAAKLPAYTEIYTSSPNAAGLPILEIIKRLEEESIITKQDRLLLKDAIYSENLEKREEIVKVLCDIELNNHSKFTVRRLKSILYENGSGVEASSKQQQPPQPLGQYSLHHRPHQSARPHHQPSDRMMTNNNSSNNNNNNQVETRQLSSNDTNFYSATGDDSSLSSSAALMKEKSKRIYISQNVVEENTNGKSFSNNNNNQGKKEEASPLTSSRSAVATSSAAFSKKEPSKVSPFPPPSLETSPTSYHPSPSISPVNRQPKSLSTNMISSDRERDNTNKMNKLSQSRQYTESHLTTAKSSSIAARPAPGAGGAGAGAKKGSALERDNPDDDEEEERDIWNVQDNITKVMGSAPDYSGNNNNSNILAKISKRLEQLKGKINLEKLLSLGTRRLAVLVGGGSFNPLTRMHLRTFYLAKQYLESHLGFIVLGSLLSPAHAVTVRERYRTNPSEILPSPHRLAIAQLLVTNSQWLSIDPWEMTRRRAMDYLSLLEHTSTILRETFPDYPIQVIYVSKSTNVPILSPTAMRAQNFHCVTVCRSNESDYLRANLSSKWNGIMNIVEDNAILDASLDMVTSRKVRDKMKNNESVEQLVGMKINEYVNVHRLGPKMTGQEKWTKEETVLPKIASRPAGPVLQSQILQQSTLLSGVRPLRDDNNDDESSTIFVKKGVSENGSKMYVPSWNTAAVAAGPLGPPAPTLSNNNHENNNKRIQR